MTSAPANGGTIHRPQVDPQSFHDLRGAGYNTNQARIAIGSGGLTGNVHRGTVAAARR